MLRLLRLSARKPGLSSPFRRKPIECRVESPVTGGSILMTSAPMSPSSMQQNGPAMTCEMSSTLMPANGSVAIFLLPYAPYGGADFESQIILYMI
ncbi:hypothetical protein SFOMI_0001 [Sphingobium fuliginis]|uniref:Uncharacterized protein n=1 Tax=Sphingobium fuliginis (strain ATCC 27551) TaxID=336203 RepID=A0A292YTK1_SPHSA|nr:hypothetical protein SFOMI_0001 [Sphingobium fuliginis]